MLFQHRKPSPGVEEQRLGRQIRRATSSQDCKVTAASSLLSMHVDVALDARSISDSGRVNAYLLPERRRYCRAAGIGMHGQAALLGPRVRPLDRR